MNSPTFSPVRIGGSLRFLVPSLLLPVGACLTAAEPAAPKPQPPPNIVFILADDLGYVDTNRYAEHLTGVPAEQQFYETPNLDRLGREGTSFAQAYSCPL